MTTSTAPDEGLAPGAEYRIYGPPGTGKTTFLKAQVEKEAREYGSDAVVVTSFTKAAAQELVARDLPIAREHIGTLHALCYRALGAPPVAEGKIQEWNDACPIHLRLSGAAPNLDEPETEFHGDTPGDEIFQRLQRLRALRRPRELWPYEVKAFAEHWEKWKEDAGYIDFTDMIEQALERLPHCPGQPTSLLVDEAQDLSTLELALVRQWGSRCSRFFMAGDEDQCSLPGALVETTTGPVPVEFLDPAVHRLLSYDRVGAAVVGKRNGGYGFQIAVHHHDGEVVRVRAGGRCTETTPDHIWEVKWTERAKEAQVVYLMEDRGRFRVGWCQLFRADGCLHLGAHARLEGAERAWILAIFEDKAEASIYESYIAARWGIPTITFLPKPGAGYYSAENLARFWAMYGAFEGATARAIACLVAHGRYIHHPFWTQANTHQGGQSILTVRACNLLGDYMAVPVTDEKVRTRVSWEPLQTERPAYAGPVYGLKVERHHRYIADGLVTHNCLYQFKGASVESFLEPLPDSQKRVLKQSYRVPGQVHEFSQRWIRHVTRREPKEYRPRDAEGTLAMRPEITWQNPAGLLPMLEADLAVGGTAMVLASCSYMLSPLIKLLREAGLAYANPWRTSRRDWNPLHVARGVSSTQRLFAYLAPQERYREDPHMWTWEEVMHWGYPLATEGVFHRGAKKALLDTPQHAWGVEPTIMELLDTFTEPAMHAALDGDLDWYQAHVLAKFQKTMGYPLQILRKRGAGALREPPRIFVGTVHSVKGGEASSVYLFPDVSRAGAEQWTSGPEGRDALIRLFYVGMTRAREALTLLGPSSGLHVPLYRA